MNSQDDASDPSDPLDELGLDGSVEAGGPGEESTGPQEDQDETRGLDSEEEGTPWDVDDEGSREGTREGTETDGAAEHGAAGEGEEEEAKDEGAGAQGSGDTQGDEIEDGDTDGNPEGDEFGFTRERVADPDDWTIEERAEARAQDPNAVESSRLTPEEEKAAHPFRILFHLSAITAALLTVMAAILHFAADPIRGLETIYVFLATALVLLATYAFPLARFPEKRPRGPPEQVMRTRTYRILLLRGYGVVFAIAFGSLVILEFVAALVALQVLSLPMGSLLLARHFILVPVFVVGVLVGALYSRMHVPSREDAEPLAPMLTAAATGVFAFFAVLALFFAAGFGPVVRYTGIEPRQAVYIAGVGLACAVVVVNLRLRIPNVVRIVQAEIKLAKQVDRPAAQDMQKRMMRNYVIALLFVVGSIAFLASRATGLMRPGASASLDVVLIVYLGLGALFLGIVAVNYVQAKQIGNRLILNSSGKAGPGKKRFTPEQVTRFTVYGISGAVAFLLMVFMLLVATGTLSRLGPLVIDPGYATDFFVFAVIAAIGPFGFMWAREAARIRGIDDKFPDFLRDLAESQKAGMTLPRALLTASQGAYGPLTKEIKIMASQVEWGVSFNEALQRFALRTRTPLIERTVSLVCEAASSGGNVVEILSAASEDAREIKNIMVERKQHMSVYSMIIYIAFGVFLVVIGVLNSQFIPELAAAAGDAAGESVGGLRFGNIDVPTYQRIFWHAAIAQGIGGGLVAGVMTDGHPFSGLRHSVIMTAVAYVVFRFLII